MSDARIINLSLISHTNAGKTTLARTLLGMDVGEVRDAPHVTDVSSVYTMVAAGDGCELRLWDTPGFGDTVRLLKRLRESGNPITWVLSQTWDRYADRPLWCSQEALRNAREEADIVLYMVNAAEPPEDAGYVTMEMEILTWIGKPVILMLNQKGPPREPKLEQAEEDRWRQHLKNYEVVKEVLSLDAFARCWIQEGLLLKVVGGLLPMEKQGAFAILSSAWRDKNLDRFHRSMGVLARQLVRAVTDREEVPEQHWIDQFLSLFRSDEENAKENAAAQHERAMIVLAERLDEAIRSGTDEMIVLHGLNGRAAQEIFRRLREDYATDEPVDTGFAAAVGGFITGALGGLAADIASGGMSLGLGIVGGGILGALGGGGLAKGYNLVMRKERALLRWSEEFFEGLVRSALLRYLAVAHFGRGRGDYAESERPAFWQSAAAALVLERREPLGLLWERGGEGATPAELTDDMEALVTECAADLLERLYPEAERLIARA